MAIARKIFEPGHPTLLTNMNNLASMLIDLNKLDAADVILTEASETGRHKLGTLDQPMDVIILQLGRLRAKQKRFDEAVNFANELYRAVAGKYGERHIRTLSAVILVYDNLIQANRFGEGVTIVEKIGELPPEVTPDLRQRLEALLADCIWARATRPSAPARATGADGGSKRSRRERPRHRQPARARSRFAHHARESAGDQISQWVSDFAPLVQVRFGGTGILACQGETYPSSRIRSGGRSTDLRGRQECLPHRARTLNLPSRRSIKSALV